MLDGVAEVPVQVRVGDHHRLPEQGPALGAPDVEHVAQPGQIGKGHVCLGRGQRVAHPGPVQEQVQAVLVADPAQGGELLFGVEGAVFRGVGEVHHLGLHHVLRGHAAGEVLPAQGLHLAGGELALRAAGDLQHLVAGGLHRPGLVAVDVPCHRGDDPLVRPQGGADYREVCLGAPHQEVHPGLRGGAGLPDQGPGLLAVGVLPVAHGLLEVGLLQLL